MSSITLRPARVVATLALLLGTAACGDSSGPKIATELPLETSAVYDKQAELDAVMSQEILQEINSSAFSASVRTGTAMQRVRVADLLGGAQGQADVPALRGALQAIAPRGQFTSQAVVPAEIRGRTFVRDLATWAWKIDSVGGQPRGGAPSNGVRFIVQRHDPVTGELTDTRLGHLDLLDFSSSSAIRYTTRIVTTAGLTVFESTTSIGTSQANPSLSQTGFITDGTRRITQTIVLNATRLTYVFDAPFAGFRYALTVSGDPETESGTIDMVIRIDGTTVRMLFTATATGGTARIYVNGGLFAQAVMSNGDVEPTDWTKADGTPLDASDFETIMALGQAFESLATIELGDIGTWWAEEAAGF